MFSMVRDIKGAFDNHIFWSVASINFCYQNSYNLWQVVPLHSIVVREPQNLTRDCKQPHIFMLLGIQTHNQHATSYATTRIG